MATSQEELRTQRQDLLDSLEPLEETIDALTEMLRGAAEPDEVAEHHQQLAWLDRQRAGLLVVLSETERALFVVADAE